MIIELRHLRIRKLRIRDLRMRKLRFRKLRIHDTEAVVKIKATTSTELNDALWESTNCLHSFVKSTCNKDTSGTNENTIH